MKKQATAHIQDNGKRSFVPPTHCWDVVADDGRAATVALLRTDEVADAWPPQDLLLSHGVRAIIEFVPPLSNDSEVKVLEVIREAAAVPSE